ncbi:MAG: hypothetical protein KatS3mg109_0024 [Pirellulaceae bacterium]|nr:MAG: hypothetical protein KatS3mg109_0024 [Pirellulaceae bacterium]
MDAKKQVGLDNDFVDVELTGGDESVDQVAEVRSIKDPAEVQRRLSELEESQLKASADKETGSSGDIADDESVEKRERIEELKKDPDIRANRAAFVLEMAGLQPFKKSYRMAGGVIECEFSTLSAAEMEEVRQQSSVDLTVGRVRSFHPVEVQQLATNYRMAGCLRRLLIKDPESQEIKVSYDKGVPLTDSDLEGIQDVTSKDCDLYRRWVYLRDRVLRTQTLSRLLQEKFADFEQLQLKMLELLELEPSFFTG